jgi:hypothetical protein
MSHSTLTGSAADAAPAVLGPRPARWRLSAVVPMFNEAGAIDAFLDALMPVLDTIGAEAEVICLDADLQHPPGLIPEMLARGREGWDVVAAVRRGREAGGEGP